jgi:hypothetical protein
MTLTATLDVSGPRAGLRQAVKAERAKLLTLRSTTWALLITLVGAIAVTFLATHGARPQRGEAAAQGFDPTNTALAGLALASLVVGILGILSMTGEYASGTIRSSLAAMPRRGVFFGAKVIVLAAFSLAVGLVVSFMSFFEGQAVLSGGAPTATLGDPNVLGALLGSAGFLALGALFGLGIGAIIRHSAGAIATFVGCTLLLPVLVHNVPGNPGRFMPVMLLGNSVAAVVPLNNALSGRTAFLLMALYTAATLAVAAVVVARRDA